MKSSLNWEVSWTHSKLFYWKLLRHCPTIYIICIPILKIWRSFIFIINFHVFAFSLNRWNETAGLTARNFSKGDFSELKQFCSYLHSCIIHDFDIFMFFKNSRQKSYFFHFLKSYYFPVGCCRRINLGTFWEIYLGFLKMLFLTILPNLY